MAPTNKSKRTNPGDRSRNTDTTARRDQNKRKGPLQPQTNGGIQKRRTLARTDKDGDLDMGAEPRSNDKNQRRTANPTDAKHGRGKGGVAFLKVSGLEESGIAVDANKRAGLVRRLEVKANERMRGKPLIAIEKAWAQGHDVILRVRRNHAETILGLNGLTHSGAKLAITEKDSNEAVSQATERPETVQIRTKLQQVLGARYMAEAKVLSLGNLASDPELMSLGAFENRRIALKTFTGLMAICDSLFKTPREKQNAVDSISLADNSIDNVNQVESVATTFPDLKRLDLERNQLANLESLSPWKTRFKYLEAILLGGNPIEANEPAYHMTLKEWFPRLQDVSGVPVRTPEEASQNCPLPLERAIPQHGPDFRDVGNIGENFLLEFFAAYDQDRQGLLARLYDEMSHFSLAVDTAPAREPDVSGMASLPWAPYIKSSRNQLKITTFNARKQRLFRGVEIASLWETLPASMHPSIKDDMAKYIMDCHSVPGLVDPSGQSPVGVDGLMVSVHGQFQEEDRQAGVTGFRSFSRVFILGPGQPGRGPFRVVSDMLSLRAYSPLPNIFGQPNVPATPAAPSPQQAMIQELAKQTGMTENYSRLCLEQADWDYNRALMMFNEKKAELPPEAFKV